MSDIIDVCKAIIPNRPAAEKQIASMNGVVESY